MGTQNHFHKPLPCVFRRSIYKYRHILYKKIKERNEEQSKVMFGKFRWIYPDATQHAKMVSTTNGHIANFERCNWSSRKIQTLIWICLTANVDKIRLCYLFIASIYTVTYYHITEVSSSKNLTTCFNYMLYTDDSSEVYITWLFRNIAWV